MSNIAVICTLDPLGSRSQAGRSYFGLTLSVGVRGDAAYATQVAAWLRPWNWTIRGVEFQRRNGNAFQALPANVSMLDVHATAMPSADAEFQRLIQEHEERWTQYSGDATRFVWDDALKELEITDDAIPNAATQKKWSVFLANSSSIPYPYSQWLNLSVHIVVTWTGVSPSDSDQIIAAPLLTLRAAAGGVGSDRSLDAVATPVPPDGSGEVEWRYGSVAGQPDVYAHCGAVTVKPPIAGSLDNNSLWVTAPQTSSIFGHDWRAELERGAPLAFDLSQRVLDAFREDGNNATSTARIPAVRRLVLATLADRAGYGAEQSTGGAITAIDWLIQQLRVRIDAANPVLQQHITALVAIQAEAKRPHAVSLTDWISVLASALHSGPGLPRDFAALRPAANPPAAGTAAEAVTDLQAIHDLLRNPIEIAEVMLARWRALGVPFSDALATEFRAIANSPAGEDLRAVVDRVSAAPIWSTWLRALPVQASSEKHRSDLRDNFRPVIERAIIDRFGVTGIPNTLPVITKLVDALPRVDADQDAVKNWLLPFIVLWTDGVRDALVPETGDSAARPTLVDSSRALSVATRVPHPLSIEVGLSRYFQERTSTDGDVELRADREDAMRRYSGFGVMMRRSGEQNRIWRCLNLAAACELTSPILGTGEQSARMTVDRWGKHALIAPLRMVFRDDLSDSVVSYDNRPLTAMSPDALLGDHGLVNGGAASAEAPVLTYHYIPPSEFPGNGLDVEWASLEALVFGRTYDVAVFAVTNSGCLPEQLVAGPDTVARLKTNPATVIPPPGTTQTVWYPRRVAIGQPRLAKGATNASPQTIATPAIPDDVFPRARELFGKHVMDTGPEGSFLLLCPPGASSTYDKEFRFEVRRPSTDIQTWLRWQLESNLTSAQLAEVVREYYGRMSYNHEHGDTPALLKSVSIDDPCVAQLAFVLREYDDDSDSWRTCGAIQSWIPTQDPTDGIVLSSLPADARTNGGRLSVKVQTLDIAGNADKAEVTPAVNNTITVRVVEGRIYKLVVANVIDGVERFDPSCAVGWAPSDIQELFPDMRVMSPWTLSIEVATARWTAKENVGTAKDQEEAEKKLLKGLYNLLLPQFSLTAIRESESRLDLTVNLNLLEHRFISRCDLHHQRWRWNGRSTDIQQFLPKLDPANWQRLFILPIDSVNWDAAEFGNRAEIDMAEHEMQMKSVELVAASKGRRTDSRSWYHSIDLTGDYGASYHRFAMLVHHRYAGLFAENVLPPRIATTTIGSDPWRWHSFIVPARPRGLPPCPVVRAILPLTSRVDDDSTFAKEKTPGLLVVVAGPAFENGGLAEQLHAQGVIVSLSTRQANGSIKTKNRFEIAPDPKDTGDMFGDEWDPTEAKSTEVKSIETAMSDLRVVGPIGHSFDPDGVTRRMTTASYIIEPPLLGRDLTNYFLKLRFGRALDPHLVLDSVGAQNRTGIPEEWSEGHWTQLLRDARLVSTGARISDFQLRVTNNEVQTLKDSIPTTPNAKDGRPIHALLALTRQIADVSGHASEAWVGLYRERSPGIWHWVGDSPGLAPTSLTLHEDGVYIARVLYVLRGDPSKQDFSFAGLTESDIWDRMFEPYRTDMPEGRIGVAIRERLQIVGITQSISNRKVKP